MSNEERDTALSYYSSLKTDIKKYSISGLKSYCRVLDIYDGDTIIVALQVHDNCYKYTVRMLGIDTCELNSKNINIKLRAIKARNTLIEYIIKPTEPIDVTKYNKQTIKDIFAKNIYLVWIECSFFEKYGRLLANVYINHDDKYTLAEKIINIKLGYYYDGNKKMSEKEQLNNIIL